MITKEKGYSLNVLVITIAVMIILTTTAVLTMRSMTADKEITNFMSDLQETEEFVKEYYLRKETLPVVLEGNRPREITIPEDMQSQVGENDAGGYYEIDLAKLDGISLYDYDRLYLLNEESLKVYVMNPVKYNNVDYYTLTDELLGIEKIYGIAAPFEIVVAGNPVTWVSGAKLLVSIPDHEDIGPLWSFKYYKGGPITAEQFKTMGTFFEYGETINVTENDTYSIYVEDENGYSKVRNIVVEKIDERNPYVYVTNTGGIVVGDDETGINEIRYKIIDYSIGENERATDVETYFQGTPDHIPDGLDDDTWSWTCEEAYTGERVDGVVPSKGRDVNSYKADYQEYLERYAEISTDPSGDVSVLDDEFPQFQHDGVPYSDSEENIVLYVEDYAGNRSVTDRNLTLCKVSREMLLANNLVDMIVVPLGGVRLTINDGARYTKSRTVDLLINSMGAESMYITTDASDVPSDGDWQPFNAIVNSYELPDVNGEVTVYVYVTANQYVDGSLKYEVTSAQIYLDTVKPTNTAPTVQPVESNLLLTIESNQIDNESGIEQIIYGYKLVDEVEYIWSDTGTNIEVRQGSTYNIKTRAVDKAGNVQDSEVIEIQTPIQEKQIIPNEPAMATGMTAIVWDGTLAQPGNEIEIDSITWKDENGNSYVWYDYNSGDGITDTRNSIWANAKTAGGSYFVWIPRFAYKITYFEDANKTTIKGYHKNSISKGIEYFESDGTTVATNPDDVRTKYVTIDILFLNGTSNTQYKEKNLVTNVVNIKTLPEEYIVHPAFQRVETSSLNNSLGKWGTELTGIWVAKFEASRSDATFAEGGTSDSIMVVPNVKSCTEISISDAYDYCSDMNIALSSHLMKSSEWGAVAYLTHSAYGRNGNEVSSNRYEGYVTGGGGTTSSYTCTESTFENTYAFDANDTNNGKAGMYASTTGNIYGIFDMAGGTAEYVATYLNNSDSNIRTNGQSLTQTISTYFREVYSVASTDAPINNYRKNGADDGIYGNAIYETSTGYLGAYGINSDITNYPSESTPFFVRGGAVSDGTGTGIFAFDDSNGEGDISNGFRPVLAFR